MLSMRGSSDNDQAWLGGELGGPGWGIGPISSLQMDLKGEKGLNADLLQPLSTTDDYTPIRFLFLVLSFFWATGAILAIDQLLFF